MVWAVTPINAIVKKLHDHKKVILATGLIGVVVTIIGYYTIQGIGYASIQGIYIRMFGWTRCYSGHPISAREHKNQCRSGIFDASVSI
jgi:hypothetical protein